MTIEKQNGNLRVVLSDAETVLYGIDSVFFENESAKSKAALKNLLYMAAVAANFCADTTDFLIEIYPVFDGGCEVFFIPSKRKHRLKAVKKEKTTEHVMIELLTPDAVLELCQCLFTTGAVTMSRLFKYKNNYRLILNCSSDVSFLIGEFSKDFKFSQTEIVKTVEHGKQISVNTVEKIGKQLYSRKSHF